MWDPQLRTPGICHQVLAGRVRRRHVSSAIEDPRLRHPVREEVTFLERREQRLAQRG